ncbi:MFS transporter [Malikia granosa]|uniref:MFS transporter n=1 Tax=Malikia granosa TaxID=263067 RepID=A0A2S9K4I6_9BURK|nr:MFS transporter [Malikia granosa]PRD65373.1 MFS transporter [Malikia granosa]
MTGAAAQDCGQHSGRTVLAIALAGFASFWLLFGAQPLLPQIAREFGVTPAAASLSISAATAAMALLLIPVSLLGDRHGRERLMRAGVLGAAVFTLLSALVPDFPLMLACRLGTGICVAAVPASALAHLGEEIPVHQRSRAIGLYISANALGGMLGRLLGSLVTQWLDWRAGLLAQGLLGAGLALAFWRLLPPARQFSSRTLAPAALLRDLRRVYTATPLPWIFGVAFLVMGSFIGVYNYLGFRLAAPPYSLEPAVSGSIFMLYSIGSLASAWAGSQSQRLGELRTMLMMSGCMLAGLLLTLLTPLTFVIAGLACFTFGVFALHAVASAWVGHKAGERRGLVSALYLSSYHFGGSVIGSAAGWAWTHHGWPGIVSALASCVLLVTVTIAGLRVSERGKPG